MLSAADVSTASRRQVETQQRKTTPSTKAMGRGPDSSAAENVRTNSLCARAVRSPTQAEPRVACPSREESAPPPRSENPAEPPRRSMEQPPGLQSAPIV